MEQHQAAGAWKVVDKNAIAAPRRHEIIVRTFPNEPDREPITKTYALSADTGTEMPMEHALKFLSDAAFEVIAPDGTVMVPPPKNEGGTGAFELPDHQTIANFDELSVAALFKRCKVVPGSEQLSPQTPKDDLVAFLVAYRKKLRLPNGHDDVAEALSTGDLAGAAPKETLDKMFGDSPILANAH